MFAKDEQFVGGVDGCKRGWLTCLLSEAGGWSFFIFGSASAVLRYGRGADLILVDVPIGIHQSGFRECDVLAKKELGKDHSRVYMVPPRPVLSLSRYDERSDLCKSMTGKGMSVQTNVILPLVSWWDRAVAENNAGSPRTRECHPEVCFKYLNDGKVLQTKHSHEGLRQRREVLSRFILDFDAVLAKADEDLPRGAYLQDDLLDAMVCAVTAAGVWDGSLRTLPEFPERDERGLAMEMVYRVPR
jgi:predicted RNase H-like nuclease